MHGLNTLFVKRVYMTDFTVSITTVNVSRGLIPLLSSASTVRGSQKGRCFYKLLLVLRRIPGSSKRPQQCTVAEAV